ncbi:RNA polymerase sigma factor [Parabacteroides sp. PF5-9]|uniref:RNA polymerase sigma factor n=1 Tax=Parabacteroides sp. PF5-9 TaxID=1742404 RepID=UPI00247373A0|nr:RNA polymerase sigma factor [Parabacteroides sp. PF5-9]MDH6358094.1 RNA polymerase sigma factor (sigma-70 family) [Parabacteroides sp. PF5-9]
MNQLQFEENLLSIQKNMFNFAMQLTSNSDDAEDLMQDTTLRVLGCKDKFTDNINFKGWVLTIMRNLFINNYHKMIRTQSVIDSNADIYNLDITGDGYSSPESNFRLLEIATLINRLNPDFKKPFSLFLSGYSYNEIAAILAIPLGTVKSRIFFARRILRKTLKQYRED